MTKIINNNFDYNEEVKKCKTIDDVMGKKWINSKVSKRRIRKYSRRRNGRTFRTK